MTCPKAVFTVDPNSNSKAVFIDGIQIAAKIRGLLKKDIERLQQ